MCWRGGEERTRWKWECKGRTQTEGNWKINPGWQESADRRTEQRIWEEGIKDTAPEPSLQEKDQIYSLLRWCLAELTTASGADVWCWKRGGRSKANCDRQSREPEGICFPALGGRWVDGCYAQWSCSGHWQWQQVGAVSSWAGHWGDSRA